MFGELQVTSVKLPPHLQNGVVCAGRGRIVAERPQFKIPKSCDADYANGVRLPESNPFLLPFLSASSPDHCRTDSPGRQRYVQGHGLEDRMPHYPHLCNGDDRRQMGPAHEIQYTHMRNSPNIRPSGRRRSATPVLDITAIPQRNESPSSTQFPPEHSTQDYPSTRPKKKHKGQDTVVVSQWVKAPDKIIGSVQADEWLPKSHEVQNPGLHLIGNSGNGGLQMSFQPATQGK